MLGQTLGKSSRITNRGAEPVGKHQTQPCFGPEHVAGGIDPEDGKGSIGGCYEGSAYIPTPITNLTLPEGRQLFFLDYRSSIIFSMMS